MRSVWVLALVLFLVALAPEVQAAPAIENLSVGQIWLGHPALITGKCTDTESIASVTASVVGPDIVLPEQTFVLLSGMYQLLIPEFYLTKVGTYNGTVTCKNSLGESTQAQVLFPVSSLTLELTAPPSVFSGQAMTIAAKLKKDGTPITPDAGPVTFSVTANQPLPLNYAPPYDLASGFLLSVMPPPAGSYSLLVTANYSGTSVAATAPLTVVPFIDISVYSVDKVLAAKGDNLTIAIQAIDKGNPVALLPSQVSVSVGGAAAALSDFQNNAEITTFKAQVPGGSGSSELKTTVTYQGKAYTDTRTIFITIPVSGKLEDDTGKGIGATLQFTGSSGSFLLTTDSSGTYAGAIPPGSYTLTVTVPKAIVRFTGLTITAFNDPLRISVPSSSVQGFSVAAIALVESSLPFATVEVTLPYDEQKLPSEDKAGVYWCSSWNGASQKCDSSWDLQAATVDKIKNEGKFNTTSTGAFLVGAVAALQPSLTLDKTIYTTHDLIRVNGIVIAGSPPVAVSGVTITGTLGVAPLTPVTTGADGTFSFELLPPGPCTCMLTLTFAQNPFTSVTKTLPVEVVKKQQLVVVPPESVKIERGKELDFEILIVNSGDTEFADVQISFSGIPDGYATVSPTAIPTLAAGAQEKIHIHVQIPGDASKGTLTATLRAQSGAVSSERAFGFTILAPAEIHDILPAPRNASGQLTGNVFLTSVGWDSILVLVIAAVSFVTAAFWRRRKPAAADLRGVLSGIRRQVETAQPRRKRGRR